MALTTRRTVDLDDRTVTVSFDPIAPLGHLQSAVVIARLVDEVTGRPAVGRAAVDTSFNALHPRVASDGLAGLVGIPFAAFPGLATQAYSVPMTFHVDGYVPFAYEAQLPAQPGFPATFTPDRAEIPLRRSPMTIRGRLVVEAGGSPRLPVAGGSVRISGIWLQPPDPTASNQEIPADFVAIDPPLLAPRVIATGVVQRRTVTITAGADKLLTADVATRVTTVPLSDRTGLAVGDLLVVDADDPGRIEYVEISSIGVPSDATLPGTVDLANPLSRNHRRSAVARRGVPQAPGASTAFTRDAVSGDTCVFLASVAALASGNVVEVNGGAASEYHVVSIFGTTTDADGFYRLPPLNRVAQVCVEGSGGAPTAKTVTFSPTAGLTEDRLDLVQA
jgi:hypothetical protein